MRASDVEDAGPVEVGGGCEEGRLSLTFADEAVLIAEPDDRHEAFTVVGQRSPATRKFLFVASPGGGLVRW